MLLKSRFVEMFIDKGYPMITLDDLSISGGEYGAQSAAVKYAPNRPRYVRITDINDDGSLNDDCMCSESPDDDELYKLSYGDFLFARMGATVGKTYAYTSGNQIFAGYLIRYKLNLEKIIPEYLFSYTRLNSYWNWVNNNQSGAAQPGINAKKYGKLLVPVPPLDEQKKFNEFSKQLDKLKVILNQIDEKIELLKKSRFVEMYSQIESEEEKLSDICDVRDGTHDSPKYVTDGYPLITSKNVTSGRIDFSTANLISKEDFDAINKRSKVNINDIIMPMIGTIGFPVIVETNKEFAIKNVALIRTSECNRMLPEFLCSFFNSSFFEKQLAKISRGGTQKFISLGNIRDLMVKVPSLEVQKQFCNYVRQLDKLKVAIHKELELIG